MNDQNIALLNEHTEILAIREMADSTISSYTSYLTQYIEWVEKTFPDRELSSITWAEMRLYIKHLQKDRKLNNRTINGHLSQLRDFYQYVLHLEWVRHEIPILRFDEKEPAVPTREEVLKIINSIDNPKHKAEISLLYSSGIRISELCHLHCGDIHMSNMTVFIAKAKNRSQRRSVLAKRALEDLTAYIRSSYTDASPDDWLFPGQKHGNPVSDESVRNVFKAHLKAVGLDGRGYTPHSLRHAFGLHLYNAGTDLITIKEAMGHKSLSSTMIYVNLGIGNGRTVKSPYDD